MHGNSKLMCIVWDMVFDYHMRDFTGNYKLLFAKVVTLNFHAASAHLQGRHIISTVCNVLQVSPSVAVFFFLSYVQLCSVCTHKCE